jgi:hypothetical protein
VPEILLCTLNAKFAHASFGLRYLFANLGPLQSRAAILEFDINQRPIDVLEAILARSPRILGLGVYIWNIAPATQLVADLKRVARLKQLFCGDVFGHGSTLLSQSRSFRASVGVRSAS